MPFTGKWSSYSQFDIESNTFSRKNRPWIKSHLMNVLASITSRKGYWCPTKKLKIYFESAETAEFNKNESTVLSVTYSMAQSWYIYNLRISRGSAWCIHKNISLLVYRNSSMELYSITKGNFNLDKTKESYRHENNLRFHVKDDNGKFYEFNINSWNKKTINLSMNLLSSVKRPRIRTEKFEIL